MFNIFQWFSKKDNRTAFEKTFDYLNYHYLKNGKATFDLLKILNVETPDNQVDNLISTLQSINFSSNTNNFFYFYFPIVTHILYYKPHCAEKILHYLVEPNFANGSSDTTEMIAMIQGAMNYKLAENPNFLSLESQSWITHELPKLTEAITHEINKCWKELEE